MAIDKHLSKTRYSSQTIDNVNFDEKYQVSRRASYEYDPTTDSFVPKNTTEKPMALKVTVDGSITYVGKAVPGTAQSTAKWQCQKIDESASGTTIITWADSGNFSQVAIDLTSLSYS